MDLDRLALSYTVSFHVSLEVIVTCVSLCTQLTSEGSNSCMVHGMFLQFAAAGETLPAFKADIRSLPGVNAHVKGQFARHGESSIT